MKPLNKKIKILYGLEASDGGTLKHLTYLVCHLNRALFDITVIISASRSNRVFPAIRQMEEAGATVLNMPMIRSVNLLKDMVALVHIINHLSNNQYDVIHAHSSKAGVLLRIAGWLKSRAKILYTPNCFYSQSKTGMAAAFFSWVEKYMSRISDYIIVAHHEKRFVLDNKIARSNKLVNINNAINFDEYPVKKKNCLRKQFGISEETPIVGAIGRLTQQKDWETYIYAARDTLKLYPDVVFFITGDGELFDAVNSLIIQLQLQDKIIFTGYQYDTAKVYADIDVLVNTSLWEGLPYVFLEAMWYKKPIIATNLGYNVIVNEETGYLVKPKDHQTIAQKIKTLLSNKKLLKKMGENGHRLVTTHCSFTGFIKKHEELYLNQAGR